MEAKINEIEKFLEAQSLFFEKKEKPLVAEENPVITESIPSVTVRLNPEYIKLFVCKPNVFDAVQTSLGIDLSKDVADLKVIAQDDPAVKYKISKVRRYQSKKITKEAALKNLRKLVVKAQDMYDETLSTPYEIEYDEHRDRELEELSDYLGELKKNIHLLEEAKPKEIINCDYTRNLQYYQLSYKTKSGKSQNTHLRATGINILIFEDLPTEAGNANKTIEKKLRSMNHAGGYIYWK